MSLKNKNNNWICWWRRKLTVLDSTARGSHPGFAQSSPIVYRLCDLEQIMSPLRTCFPHLKTRIRMSTAEWLWKWQKDDCVSQLGIAEATGNSVFTIPEADESKSTVPGWLVSWVLGVLVWLLLCVCVGRMSPGAGPHPYMTAFNLHDRLVGRISKYRCIEG